MTAPAELDSEPELEWRDYEVLNGVTTRLPVASAAHNFLLEKLTGHLARWLEACGTGVVLPGAAFKIGKIVCVPIWPSCRGRNGNEREPSLFLFPNLLI